MNFAKLIAKIDQIADAQPLREGWEDMMKAVDTSAKEKGTDKFDKKEISTGTQYTRKSNTFTDGGTDSDVKAAKKKVKEGEVAEDLKDDAVQAWQEALATQIYDLSMLIHNNDRMYASDSPQDNAKLKQLQKVWDSYYPGRDAIKLGSELNKSQQRQKQSQQANTEPQGIMQKAKNTMSGMFKEGAMPMKKVNGKSVPAFAADGKGKNDLKKKKEKIDEGIIDKLKGLLVPKLIKLLGPDAQKIASAVKQAAGGDLTPSEENAMKVVQALGINKAANKPEMAEGIAGNWQGKLIQALYSLGLLGSAGAAASMFGTIAGGNMAVIGFLLLIFADTFFGTAPGQVGVYGKFGNKGTDAQNGLDDNGMPVKNTNLDESSKKKKLSEGEVQQLSV